MGAWCEVDDFLRDQLEMFRWLHRDAGFFAANTYTTLGYGSVILPPPWKMLAPIMAISGLFTFGWTGSVLVDIVGRVNRLKDLAEQRPAPAPEIPS